MRDVYLRGIGHYVPDNIYTNEMLSDTFDIPRETGERYGDLLGVKRRPICMDFVNGRTQIITGEQLAHGAAARAIRHAGLVATDIDTIISCASFFDYIAPPISSRLLKLLSIERAMTFDLVGGCAEFLHGLHLALNLIRLGEADEILVTASEVISAWWAQIRHPLEYFIFGDTGGAFVLSAMGGEYRIVDSLIRSVSTINGQSAELICLPIIGGKSTSPLFYSNETVDERVARQSEVPANVRLVHNGRLIGIGAPHAMIEATSEILSKAGVDPAETFLVPHQASKGVLKALAGTGVPPDQILSSLSERGNMSTASIPVTLAEHRDQVDGAKYLTLTTVGVGMSYGAMLLERAC